VLPSAPIPLDTPFAPAAPTPAPMPVPQTPAMVIPVAAQPAQPPRPPGPGAIPVPLPAGETSASSEYADLLELPGFNRVFMLESEEASKRRMEERVRTTKPGERLEFPPSPELSRGRYAGRNWPETKTYVEPSYVCYHKLLFEQINLERYGWDLGPITPVASALKTYVDVALLPYHLATDPFRNYECSAGYCMPGDPVPFLLYPPELSVSGFLGEAAAVAALVVLFP
jgi:hypothetical protein